MDNFLFECLMILLRQTSPPVFCVLTQMNVTAQPQYSDFEGFNSILFTVLICKGGVRNTLCKPRGTKRSVCDKTLTCTHTPQRQT